MITREKLQVYLRFEGDDDSWQRAGRPEEGTMAGEDWVAIRNLLQELTPIKKGFATDEYAARIRAKLSEETADENIARELYELA